VNSEAAAHASPWLSFQHLLKTSLGGGPFTRWGARMLGQHPDLFDSFLPAGAIFRRHGSRFRFRPSFRGHCTNIHFKIRIIESVSSPTRHYVGFTEDLRQRLAAHNGGNLPTTAIHRPWKIATHLGFSSKKQALSFERYLKSGSGHAFARKRLWLTAAHE